MHDSDRFLNSANPQRHVFLKSLPDTDPDTVSERLEPEQRDLQLIVACRQPHELEKAGLIRSHFVLRARLYIREHQRGIR